MSEEHYLDNYKWFIDTCYDEFRFLIDKYGYRHVSTTISGYELAITYRYLSERGVVIMYEYPGFPMVMVGGKVMVSGKTKVKKFYVDLLIKKRCRENTIAKLLMEGNQEWEYGKLSHDEAKRIIGYYAGALRKCGDDVLRGDYSIFEEGRNKKITGGRSVRKSKEHGGKEKKKRK